MVTSARSAAAQPSVGHLRRPLKLLKQSTDVPLVVVDSEVSAHHGGDPRRRPALSPKPPSFCPMAQQVGKHLQPLGRELGRPTLQFFCAPGFRSLVLPAGQPLTNGPFRDAQGLRNAPLLPATLSRGKAMARCRRASFQSRGPGASGGMPQH